MKYQLLTFNNPKIQKSIERGYLTAALHLAPHMLSGVNVCLYASPGCIAACLNTSGCGGRFAAVQERRISKTLALFPEADRDKPSPAFLLQLSLELYKFAEKAQRRGLKPAVRLNATSDLPWEEWMDLEAFPVQFYDYTKDALRMVRHTRGKSWPRNYYLTFSRSESNGAFAMEVLRAGGCVTLVHETPMGKPFPPQYTGKRYVDGRVHDLRFLDPPGSLVMLSALGQAKKDTTGFVLRGGAP